jgi:hypothetical protein
MLARIYKQGCIPQRAYQQPDDRAANEQAGRNSKDNLHPEIRSCDQRVIRQKKPEKHFVHVPLTHPGEQLASTFHRYSDRFDPIMILQAP